MESVLLLPGRLLKKDSDSQELSNLQHENLQYDEDVHELKMNLASACQGPGALSAKNLQGLQNIEKSAQDAYIGANALSMLYKSDDNATDLLSLKYVADNRDDYLICAKSDGIRYLLFVANNGKCYLNDRKNQFFEAPIFIPPFANKVGIEKDGFACHYILDGELVLNKAEAAKLLTNPEAKIKLQFLIFDCLKYNGETLAFKTYDWRLRQAKRFVDACLMYSGLFEDAKKAMFARAEIKPFKRIDFFVKDFYMCHQVDFVLNSIIASEVLPHENDGLIFTKRNYPYLPGRNRGILKWKPNELNTIDFFITLNPYYVSKFSDLFEGENLFVFELYTVYGDYFHFFDFLFVFNELEYLEIMMKFREVNGKKELEGNIVECNFDHTLSNPKLNEFYDLVYEHDSDSLQNIVNNSKLRLEWDKAAKDKKIDEEPLSPTSSTKPLKNKSKGNSAHESTHPPPPKDYDSVLFDVFETRNKEGSNPIGGWKVLRSRDDKNYPNNYNTAVSMIDSIFKSNISQEHLIEKIIMQPEENQKKLKEQ